MVNESMLRSYTITPAHSDLFWKGSIPMAELSFGLCIMLFLAVALIDAGVAFVTLRTRQVHSVNIFHVTLAAMLTTVFYLCAITTENYFVSSCFSSLYFIGVDLILVCMLKFTVDFSEIDYRHVFFFWLSRFGIVWTAADFLVLLINPFREISLSYFPETVFGHIIYKYNAFLLYDLHLTLCYLMVATIVGVLIFRMIRTPKVYRRKYTSILLVFLLDVLLNLFYLLGSDFFQLDFSVLFYSVSAVLIYSAVYTTLPKSLINTTRSFVIENLTSPLLVFDYRDRVIDSNLSARALFPEMTPKQQSSMDALNVPEYFEKQGFPPFDEGIDQFEWNRFSGSEHQLYSCTRHDFYDEKDRLIGRMLMLNDISYQKDSITGLDLTPGLYRHIGMMDLSSHYPIQLLSVNVNCLGLINSALGHDKGNQVMRLTAQIMRGIVGEHTYMAKLEDGSLIAFLPETSASKAAAIGGQIRDAISGQNQLGFTFDVEFGISEVNTQMPDIYDALHETEVSMKNRKLLSSTSHESSIINSLTQTLLESDYETKEHVERTRRASRMMASAMHLTDRETSELALLCMLHDVGKVGIPTEILLKPGKLTPDEWEMMKTHADKGYRIAMASPELQGIAKMILHHHEKWDGTGYPGRLKGTEIPLLSRIITVLDSFDAMTHDRLYHKAIPAEEAKEELIRCSGTQFDPEIVNIFMQIVDTQEFSDLTGSIQETAK